MSEQNESTPKPTPPASPAGESTPKPAQPEPQSQAGEGDLGDAGKRAIMAEREARKTAEDAAKALQAELDQIKQAQMSDLERAQAEATTAQKDAAEARAEALRWRIAAKHKISDEDAETFLTGSDEESLTRQAERLAALASTTPTTPKPDLSQGGSGGSNTTAEDQIAAAEKAGDHKTAINLKAQQLAKLATADN